MVTAGRWAGGSWDTADDAAGLDFKYLKSLTLGASDRPQSKVRKVSLQTSTTPKNVNRKWFVESGAEKSSVVLDLTIQ